MSRRSVSISPSTTWVQFLQICQGPVEDQGPRYRSRHAQLLFVIYFLVSGECLTRLNYIALVPAATFPTQLTQIVLAVQHLLFTGIAPHNIQLVGDSAGGNLILQLISHILHPMADVPTLSVASPFGNILLISPWVCLFPKAEGTIISNSKKDLFTIPAILHYANFVRENTPESGHLYLDHMNVPEGWFDDITKVTRQVLITAGEYEVLKDSITVFAKRICEVHPVATYIVQENGIHADPMLDFSVPAPKTIGSLTPKMVDWLASGCSD